VNVSRYSEGILAQQNEGSSQGFQAKARTDRQITDACNQKHQYATSAGDKNIQ